MPAWASLRAMLRGARARRATPFVLACVLAPPAGVAGAVALTPLPAGLDDGRYSPSVRYLDREGVLLREVRADDATRAHWVNLDDVEPRAVEAILAAEDRRFFGHPGVDVLAVARAALTDLWHRRIVSGASTLTMQLARLVHPTPRTLLGKVAQVVVALRIEVSLTKREVLEQYINRAPFGPAIRGIDAASLLYFDKPPARLSPAESAALAAIPRGPAVYSMSAHPANVRKRRDRILDRMLKMGALTQESHDRAAAEPIASWAIRVTGGAPHLVQALEGGGLDRAQGGLAWARGEHAESITTTLDRRLQREAEFAAQATLRSLGSRHASAASAVVLDNKSGEILAYVGSPDFEDSKHGGQNDGVRARRQPGSTLKPFVYGLAMEKLELTAATALPDVELRLLVENGVYMPNNYDKRFHGPVRLRDALANSLNVPAVWIASKLGTEALLSRLRDLGFASLTRDADDYGPGLALGDGEVTLLELTNAYATLARGGTWLAVRAVRSATRAAGEPIPLSRSEARRVMPERVARVLADILQDRRARLASFGEQSALESSFSVAAKTGTSKGFRDNWTVGFTREVTVGVWVGNFDGTPMCDVSGVSGAAPLFRAVMEAAMRNRPKKPLAIDERDAETLGLVRARVCPFSGGAATAACPHSMLEWIPRGRNVDPCRMHELVAIDRRTGLRAGRGCDASFVESHVFERVDAEYHAWAHDARRPIAPTAYSPWCPAPTDTLPTPASSTLRIAFPSDGARYLVESNRPAAQQAVAVRVLAPPGTERVHLYVDGQDRGRSGAPFVLDWSLTRGEHVLAAETDHGDVSPPVHVAVE